MSFRSFFRLAAHTQLLPVLESGEETLVGGQAVIEGVMMRAPHSYCIAVRRANGEIVTEQHALPRVSEKYPIFKYPFVRGIGTLGQAMWLGIKALRFSAHATLPDEHKTGATPETAASQPDTGSAPRAAAAAAAPAPAGRRAKEIPAWIMAANLMFSVVFFIFLYKFVPLYLTDLLATPFPALRGQITFNVVDGLIRLLIFLGFLSLISRWKDIRRVFEYHGGEHRVVFNFESGRPVTIENAQRFVTWHPRCGTSFLLVVMVISIAVYALVPVEGFLAKFAARILLLPVITGISYELIRFAAKRPGSLMALLTAPGLWLQRVTTKPPADDQTAVAIRALEGAMELERAQGGELVIA
ncbi:MAG TPA: DUF1385 domain-containing protein [Bryobacteraceae bacterium]|nr:DUF1385 domain-containing protein [Bryobacteraceae bacterium]